MKRKINVCFISGGYPACHDGIGDYVAKLISSLDRESLEVSLITSNEGPIIKYIERNNISGVFPIIKKWNMFAIIVILKLIKKEKFDIIHLQFPSSKYKKTFFLCFLPFLLRVVLKKNTVTTLHEFSISYPISKLRQIFLSLGSHRVVVTDNIDTRNLVKTMVISKRKIKFIPIGSNIDVCGIDPGEKEAFLERSGFDKQAKTIVFFGFIHYNKGLECLLKSVDKAVAEGTNIQLLIISQLYSKDNAYHNKIEKMIGSLSMCKSVFVTGYAAPREVSKFLSLSDLCVLPFTDGVTLRRGTLMAALTHKKAIISTVLKEYVPAQLVDKKNIILIPVNDVEKLAEAIKILCVDDGLRKKISETAGQLSEKFSWPKIAQMHKKLYLEMINNLQ
ncbi:MAG: glycosyltransferase [Candidatus Omnitrophica bacterium]|nr:glycosyltransferase [Candidatus Omnitrophota bacterium]MDD5429317.1 glycosyltransferase [Candidatus Omnitrophota bacterium]